MRNSALLVLLLTTGNIPVGSSQMLRTVPTFTGSFVHDGRDFPYTLAGKDPKQGGTTTIPTIIVPLSLVFEAHSASKWTINAAPIVPDVLQSPIFEPFPFANGTAQYADAVQRAQFDDDARQRDWHTRLGELQVLAPLEIKIPVARGYVLHSDRTGRLLAVVDSDYIQQQVFQHLPKSALTPEKLLIALTRDVAFYSLGDATVCCSMGTHGAVPDESGTAAQAFVIGSYLDDGVIPHWSDIQGITQQLGEWVDDPLHGFRSNEFPAWSKPSLGAACGGKGESSEYLMEQPTDFMPESSTMPVIAHGQVYHLENIALLQWFEQTAASDSFQHAYSFPDDRALPVAALPCPDNSKSEAPLAFPLPRRDASTGHLLIGYWEGYSSLEKPAALRDVSPQWDIIIATFAAPIKGSTSLLHFSPPAGISEDRFKADVAYLQGQGKKVLISLGGGGEVVTLNTPEDLHNFVSSVTEIVGKYGFDGIDLDIETPSLLIQPGDTDFRKPTTPCIVNLIAAIQELREHFGDKFMLSEVPEAAQAQAGMQVYGGQFGSFLPVMYATRDILSFVDAQDYNTPPLEGLDGNYYFPGRADYHVALAEMLVAGFPVAGDPPAMFPALPPEKVAIGLPATPNSARSYTDIPIVQDALQYLVEGKQYPAAQYQLRHPSGYPGFLGLMFWAINEDRRNGYRMSNNLGPFVHSLPGPK